MTGFADFLEAAEAHPDRVALIDGAGRRLTYGQLSARSAALAVGWRREGVAKGERVLLAVPLGLDLYCALIALWRLGVVVVLPEPALGLAGLRHAARMIAPEATLLGGPYRLLRWLIPELKRIPRALSLRAAGQGEPLDSVGSDEPALISFTTGSTGAPKAIQRSHGFLAAQNAAISRLLAPERPETVDLVAFPVFALATLSLGITAALPSWPIGRPDRADPRMIRRQIAATDATRLLAPPSLCERLLIGEAAAGVEAIFTGGGPVYPDLLERLAARIPGAALHAVYGASEAEPIAHVENREIAPADWRAMREGAGLLAGRPTPETRLRILDDEIVVTGDHVNKGYLDPKRDAETKLRLDGEIWHRTGDAGRLDAEGRLWLLGRHDPTAKGRFAFPAEAAARSWPGVRAAALVVTGGEVVLALVGDAAELPRWRERADGLGVDRVVFARDIPTDRRHRSKLDRATLERRLRRASN